MIFVSMCNVPIYDDCLTGRYSPCTLCAFYHYFSGRNV